MAKKHSKSEKPFNANGYYYEPKEADILKRRGRNPSKLVENAADDKPSVSGKEAVYSGIIFIKILHLVYVTSSSSKDENNYDESSDWVTFNCGSALIVPSIAAYTVYRFRPYTSRKLFLIDVKAFIVLGLFWMAMMLGEGYFLTNNAIRENDDCHASIRLSHFPRNGFIFSTIFGITLYLANLISGKNQKRFKLIKP